MNTVTVRNTVIGDGTPKVIVPIVETTAQGIVAKGAELVSHKLDVVEWRVDFFDDVYEIPKVLEALSGLRAALGDIPILFTFRTKKEGGEKEIDMKLYTDLNAAVAGSGNADLVDVEIFSGDDVVRANINAIHEAGCKVVGSNHDFFGTPKKSDIIYRLRKMDDMGADILKVAVMPKNAADVLTLLDATREMSEDYTDKPLITMSMSHGVITRLVGEYFGSAMTFGAVGKVSAPGQIPVEQLQDVLTIIHNALPKKE